MTTEMSAEQQVLLDAIKRMEQNMEEKMVTMKRELTKEREEADEKLVKRMKLEKPPTFKKKSHEVQYRFNEDVASKLATVSGALKETPPAIEKAAAAVEEGEKLITDRNKLIRIADRSEHGWATVAEYEDDELAEDSDDEKKLFKAEARAGRKRRLAKGKATAKKNFKKPGLWWQRSNSYFNAVPATSGPVGQVAAVPGASSSAAMSQPQPSSQLGPCFVCGKMGHFKKACPVWQRAQSASSSS